MAKKRGPSIHSRAARRATSPSIDTDKSLKDVRPPSRTSAARPSVLAVHQSAGVQKKTKNGRKSQMSAKARRRHEKGLEMAEAVIERTSRKVEKSVGRSRAVKARSKNWEEINKVAEATEKAEAESDNEAMGEEGKVWETDEDMGAESTEKSGVPAPAANAAPETSAPVHADEDGDEIL